MLDEFQREEALFHFQRGQVLERANRVEEAIEEYRRAIAHYPYLREAHDALGFYYQRHGLLAKAAEEFHAVANLEGDFLSYFNLGYVLLELNRYDEAQAAFQQCLTLEPNDPATHYELSCIRFVQGDYRAALEQLQIPLQHYPEDWEVYSLLGNCQMRLGDYDAALSSFGKVLRLASGPLVQAEVIERICTVERYREIGDPVCAKDRLYAEHGVVYLGSAQDDGLQLEEFQDYHFTYPDIGTTLQRFTALSVGCGWHFTSVVALDRLARPLTDALAQLLDVPQRAASCIQPGELPLLTLAIGRESELLKLALERIPGEAISFCLGLNWLRHSNLIPDVNGVVVRGACSVPWEPELRRLRADGASPELIDVCLEQATTHILDAGRTIPASSNLMRQVRYYSRRHQRLRFVDIFDSPPTVLSL